MIESNAAASAASGLLSAPESEDQAFLEQINKERVRLREAALQEMAQTLPSIEPTIDACPTFREEAEAWSRVAERAWGFKAEWDEAMLACKEPGAGMEQFMRLREVMAKIRGVA